MIRMLAMFICVGLVLVANADTNADSDGGRDYDDDRFDVVRKYDPRLMKLNLGKRGFDEIDQRTRAIGLGKRGYDHRLSAIGLGDRGVWARENTLRHASRQRPSMAQQAQGEDLQFW